MTSFDNEKLIEEAAKAITQANDEYGEFVGTGSAQWEVFIARAALAVFEKALGEATVTPTHDEQCCDVAGGPERCGDCPLDRGRGEPSDAQVLAALNSYMPLSTTSRLRDYHPSRVEAMRAALRAASAVTEPSDRTITGRPVGGDSSFGQKITMSVIEQRENREEQSEVNPSVGSEPSGTL